MRVTVGIVVCVALAACLTKPEPPVITKRVWSKRQTADQPGSLISPRMAYDGNRKHVVLYGGEAPGNNVSDRMWELGDGGWTRITDATPGPLLGAGLVFDSSTAVS